jgi:hypothetical protein
VSQVPEKSEGVLCTSVSSDPHMNSSSFLGVRFIPHMSINNIFTDR